MPYARMNRVELIKSQDGLPAGSNGMVLRDREDGTYSVAITHGSDCKEIPHALVIAREDNLTTCRCTEEQFKALMAKFPDV